MHKSDKLKEAHGFWWQVREVIDFLHKLSTVQIRVPSKCSVVPSALHCSASSSSARLGKFVKTPNLFPTFSNVENLSVMADVAASTTTLNNPTSNFLSASLKGSSCDSYEKWRFVDLSLFCFKTASTFISQMPLAAICAVTKPLQVAHKVALVISLSLLHS